MLIVCQQLTLYDVSAHKQGLSQICLVSSSLSRPTTLFFKIQHFNLSNFQLWQHTYSTYPFDISWAIMVAAMVSGYIVGAAVSLGWVATCTVMAS